MNFENAFREDLEIPLHEAARFFVGIKKFAEWTDLPDMTGQLEGRFAAPVEQVLSKLKEIIAMKWRKMVAYFTYAQCFRDHAWRAIKIEFGEHAHDEHEDAEFYVKRAVALGGPVHMDDIDAPPPSNNPYGILKMMARAEQEAIAAQRELLQMVGDENPMRVGIEEALSHDQHHLDEMWQIMTVEEQQEIELGKGVEELPLEEDLPQAGEDEPMEVMASMRLSAALEKHSGDKVLPTDKELKETGRQRGVTALSAEAAREKGRRGERFGQSAGTIGGALGGAALGKKYIGGRAGAIAGMTAGAFGGGRLGKELGTERDIRKNASIKEKIASMRFELALMKIAQGEMGGVEGVDMASPTAGEMEPTNYLGAEMVGRQAQEANESAFYREQLGQAKEQAAMMQQQVADTQMQLQQVQEQAAQASEQIQMATQQAVAAQDAATQQTLEAAKARIGAQEMRAKMLELASMDPQQFGEQAFSSPPGGMGAQGMDAANGAISPDAGIEPPPSPEGPAGEAPTPTTPPGSVPTGEAVPGAMTGPPPAPGLGAASPAGQLKTGSSYKLAAPITDRLIGAGAGAMLGAGSSLYAGRKAPELAARAQQLEGQRDGSFLQAVQEAKAKQQAVTSELAARHPMGSAIVGGLGGAVTGALLAPGLRHEGGRLARNIREIAGR